MKIYEVICDYIKFAWYILRIHEFEIFDTLCHCVVCHPPSAAAVSLSCISAVTVTLTDGGFCTTLYHCVNTYLLLI